MNVLHMESFSQHTTSALGGALRAAGTGRAATASVAARLCARFADTRVRRSVAANRLDAPCRARDTALVHIRYGHDQ